MYRALTNLKKGNETIQAGTVFPAGYIAPQAVEALIKLGKVSQVSPPPLEVLPGWSGRAKKLSKAGIVNVADLVGAEAGTIAAALKIKEETAEKLQAEALNYLKAPKPQGG